MKYLLEAADEETTSTASNSMSMNEGRWRESL
jgi:hypothetical protein